MNGMNGRRVINIPTPSTAGDATNKNYVDQTTVSTTEDVMSGNLTLRVGNNPSIYLGCNDLRGNKRFNLLLGSTTDLIHNQVGQPVTLQVTDGILFRIGDSDIAKFNP